MNERMNAASWGTNSRLKDLFPGPRIHDDSYLTCGLVQTRPSFFAWRRSVDNLVACFLWNKIGRNPIFGVIRVDQSPYKSLEGESREVAGYLVNTFIHEEIAPLVEVPYDRLHFGEPPT